MSTPTPPTPPDQPAAPRSRRSAARRTRPDLTVWLAVGLVALTLVAAWLVTPSEQEDQRHAPDRTRLTRASVVCPAAQPGRPEAFATTTNEGAAGSLQVRTSKVLGQAGGETSPDSSPDSSAGSSTETSQVKVSEGEVATVRAGTGPLALTGLDELAPGLVAARYGGSRLAATACSAPVPDQWFTGVGAAAEHSSVLELTNPDAGSALADVEVLGSQGLLDVPRLRGVAVPGRSTVRLDLGQVTPRRGELALHVVTARGRVASAVVDTIDEVGSGTSSQDWLPAQAEPRTDDLLLGLGAGTGSRTLVLANPGTSEARASLKLVDEDSVFTPEGVEEVRVPPGSVERVSLDSVVGDAVRDGVLGVEVLASRPVTATLRTTAATGGSADLSYAVSGPRVRHAVTALVPSGNKRVVLAGATDVGAVTVVSRSADGSVLDKSRAELQPGRGTVVPVPARAAEVEVRPERTPVTAAVVVTGAGTAVLPLAEPVRAGLVPDVRPGLP